MQDWHDRGGVVTRGVLIDYKAYADDKGITYSPFEGHKITIAAIEEIARLQDVTFRQGDVILFRTGYVEALDMASHEEQQEMLGTHKSVGIEQSEEAVKWFWNNHCAAVAADNSGFEVLPPTVDGIDGVGTPKDMSEFETVVPTRFADEGTVLHQTFLNLFGLPIGEMWDLKALSKHCAHTKRYTFLLTSIPLNVPGAVASPPNALAIF
jgi:hypothetical protein